MATTNEVISDTLNPCFPVHNMANGRKANTILNGKLHIGDSASGVAAADFVSQTPVEFSGLSATNILRERNGFEVVGVDATRVPAKMVKLEAGRNSPAGALVEQPVRMTHFPPVADPCVSLGVFGALPDPASRPWINNELCNTGLTSIVATDKPMGAALYRAVATTRLIGDLCRGSAAAVAFSEPEGPVRGWCGRIRGVHRKFLSGGPLGVCGTAKGISYAHNYITEVM